MFLQDFRKILALTALLVSSTAYAKVLYVFDNPRLIAVNKTEGLTGYYGAEHRVAHFSCSFFFYESGQSNDVSFPITSFTKRGERVPGRVFSKGKGWIVQTDEQHDGCGGAVGDFRKGPDDDHPARFASVEYIPALGIRRVVDTGAVVVALKTRGLRTYVRYVHPATGRVTTSWIETGKLENPFSSQPDALSRQVKYTVHPVTRFNGRRLGKNVSIESVQLVSGPGLSSTSIQAINAKLRDVVKGFRIYAAECQQGAQGHPWGYESKLGKVVISKRYVSVVFERDTVCGGTPDFERDAFVFAKASGKFISPTRLLKEVFPREEFRAGISSYKDLIHVNDNLAEALISDNADVLGDCDGTCDYDIRNKSYRIWMEDGQIVLFPEFSQASYINQQEYFIKVAR
ncbi:hypothetical protein GTP41_20695 [Pseudoduganella sp. DS3]|uniref:Uncharacterized protein n=1 Tax=Pseudoduganella guangdongensis TaxID=2692179 RepID=A0A6N9HLQ0_9BURK|nr:hypothetical protein [Pseudoduganella guangdongensis]MYN04514.1 hypothetical protein [Pseudoduganella guangdongensis]